MKPERFNIDNIKISCVNLVTTLIYIEEALKNNKPGYICVTNSRTAFLANKDPEYCSIQNNSLLTVPDGTPLVWIAHNQGYKKTGKVSGKDLMDSLFTISDLKVYSHYFYGSTPQTIAKMQINLKEKYPGMNIKDTVSPPFQALEEFDLDALASEINKLKPTFFWCGLGAPKQERLMALLQPKLEQTICIGVGLAFDYIAGNLKRPPIWMHKYGIEWIYRLAQQPRNIRRSIRPFSWIFVKLLLSYLKK